MIVLLLLQCYHRQSKGLIVARGVGDNVNIFNKVILCKVVFSLQAHFVTAIGNKEDNQLVAIANG